MRVRAATSQLLVIDVQERLLPHIDGQADVVAQIRRVIQGARELGLPLTVSEQYVKGLGPTVAPVAELLGDGPRLEKSTFSVCGDERLLGRLRQQARPQVLLCGIESHVCVQQTALDLIEAGLRPVLLADGVSSRRARDREVAIERMRTAGVLVTTVEAVLFEMLDRCDGEQFKRILALVR